MNKLTNTETPHLHQLERLLCWTFLISSLVISSFCYSFFIVQSDSLVDNFATITFVTFLFLLTFFYIFWIRTQKELHWLDSLIFILSGAFIHWGILWPVYSLGASEKYLWTIDTYSMHLPGSENINNILNGYESLREITSIWDKVYSTHIITGAAFYLFGDAPIIPSVVLALAKVLTLVFIYLTGKLFFSKKTALIGVVFFSLSPTILFYTISFYKEAFVQLFIIMAYYFSHRFLKKMRLLDFIFLSLSLLLLFNERFYIAPLFLLGFQLHLMASEKIKSIYKWSLTVFVGTAGVLFLKYYSGAISIFKIFDTLYHFRVAFNSYSDINKDVNINLPYAVSVVKLIFTPFFTMDKFDMFFDFSYLLIWGSLTNQIVMALAMGAMMTLLFKSPRQQILNLTPFFIFILMYAYIAPYNGRLRDSFYPIIVLYAAYGINKVFDRIGIGNESS